MVCVPYTPLLVYFYNVQLFIHRRQKLIDMYVELYFVKSISHEITNEEMLHMYKNIYM